MKTFSCIRNLMVTASQVSILLVSLCSIHNAHAQYPDPTIDLGDEGQFLWKEGGQYGRTAILMPLGPWLINMPEAPGSVTTNLPIPFNGVDNIWEFSDLANPTLVHEFTNRGMPILAHGTVIRYGENGGRMVGPNGAELGYNPLGTNTQQRMLVDGVTTWPTWIGAYSHMTSPYFMRNYWAYQFDNSGMFAIQDAGIVMPQDVNLFGRNTPRWTGEPYVYWDHFAVADVTGFQSFSGTLMVFASDQRNTGIAIYDTAGVRERRVPRLLSVFQPELLEPPEPGTTGAGNPVGIGGYWAEPYGANKMVWAARRTSLRNFPAMYVVDFEDPENPFLSCEVYFDQSYGPTPWNAGGDPADGDYSSDPMYVNFQDQYAYMDHFRIDISACEAATAAGTPITGAVYDQVVYKFDDIANQCDGSQYFRPMGQLGIFGGYDYGMTPDVNEQGMCGFVTSDTPDTNPPYISGHRPLANQTNTSVDTFIHIHIPETLRSETVENAITITNVATGIPIAYKHQLTHTGTIAIWPDVYLAPNTVYSVDVVGIQDFMGNTMVDYNFTFTTDDGDLLKGEAAFPVLDYNNPAPGAVITRAVPEAPGPVVTPTYAGPTYFPNQSSPLFCDATTEAEDIWAVNTDNDSVSIIASTIDTEMVKTHTLEKEIRILYEAPTSVTKINNFYAVTYRDDDKVVFFNPNGEPVYLIDTGHGTQPVASVGDGDFLYVSLYASGEVVKINTENRAIVARLDVGPKPKAMALTANRLLVTRFISPTTHGEVYDINTNGNMVLSRTIVVNKILVGDDIDHGSGVPNYLSSIVISSDGEIAYVSATKANTDRGLRPDSTNPQPLDGDNTVRPMVATLDLVNNRDSNQNPLTRDNTIDLDNGADPSYVSFLANPDVRVTALQGNNILNFTNTVNNSSAQFDAGGAPQGICSTRRTLYVKNFTGRSVSAIDIANYLDSGSIQQIAVEISTVTREKLSAQEKLGLDIFYHSSIPEMGVEGYMTCASCHAGGGHDGRVWDNTSFGEGLRNTISLNGSSGTRFGPLHWSSNFDEVQDFELQMETLNGGDGLIPEQTFSGESPLDMITTGQSIDLDALAAYVSGLGRDTVKHSPNRTYTGQLSATAVRGQAVFASTDLGGDSCASCHSGTAFRDGQSHDVGTITVNSGSRLSGSLTEIRTPTLIELWDSAPYFHDGSAATLEDVLSRGDHTRNYTGTQMQDLIEYLRSIDRALYIDDDVTFDRAASP